MSLLFYSSILLAVVSGISLFLFYRIKRKKAEYQMPFGFGTAAFIAIPFLIGGYLYFFQDYAVSVECSKKTMLCVHSRATEYNKTMRPVASYDFSGADKAKTERHKFKKGDFFNVIICDDNETVFTLPKNFPLRYDAKEEAQRFNRFLSSRQQTEYTFSYTPFSTSPALIFITAGIILAFLFALALMFSLIKRSETPPRQDEEPQISTEQNE